MPRARRETGPYLTERVEVAALPLEVAIAALATEQHGVIALFQLVALGLSADAVRQRVRAGRMHRVHRGVYAVGHARLTARGRWHAALLAIGRDAVLSHRAAAALHDLIAVPSGPVDVAVPAAGGRRRREGIRVHRLAALREAELTTVENVPVTSVARTIADVSRVLPTSRAERLLERAEQLGTLDADALAPRLRRLLPDLDPPGARSRSELERSVLRLCRTHALPRPLVEAPIILPDGTTILADFLWPAASVVLEADGRGAHGTTFAIERDRRRDQQLAVAGYRPIRTTWTQVTRRPGELARTLRVLLAP